MLSVLPRELYVSLSCWLDCPSLASLSQVCREVHDAIDDACWRACVDGQGWTKDWSAGDSGLHPLSRDTTGLSSDEALRVAINAQRSARGHFDTCQTWKDLATRREQSQRAKRQNRWRGGIVRTDEHGIWRLKPMTEQRCIASSAMLFDTIKIAAILDAGIWPIDAPEYTHLEVTEGFAVFVDSTQALVVYDCRGCQDNPPLLIGSLPRSAEAGWLAYKARFPLLMAFAVGDENSISLFDITTCASVLTIPLPHTNGQLGGGSIKYVELDYDYLFYLDNTMIHVFNRHTSQEVAQWTSAGLGRSGRNNRDEWAAVHHHNGDLVAIRQHGVLFLPGYRDVLVGKVSFEERAVQLQTRRSELGQLRCAICALLAKIYLMRTKRGKWPRSLVRQKSAITLCLRPACTQSAQHYRGEGPRQYREYSLQRLWSVDLEQLKLSVKTGQRPTVQILSSLLPTGTSLSRLEQDGTAIYFPVQAPALLRTLGSDGIASMQNVSLTSRAFDEIAQKEVASWSWHDGRGDIIHKGREDFNWPKAVLQQMAEALDDGYAQAFEGGVTPNVIVCLDSFSNPMPIDASV